MVYLMDHSVSFRAGAWPCLPSTPLVPSTVSGTWWAFMCWVKMSSCDTLRLYETPDYLHRLLLNLYLSQFYFNGPTADVLYYKLFLIHFWLPNLSVQELGKVGQITSPSYLHNCFLAAWDFSWSLKLCFTLEFLLKCLLCACIPRLKMRTLPHSDLLLPLLPQPNWDKPFLSSLNPWESCH